MHQDKSRLGPRLSSALRNLGLLNQAVWVDTIAVEFAPGDGDAGSRGIAALIHRRWEG